MAGASTNAMHNLGNIFKLGTLLGTLLSWPAAAFADIPVPRFSVGQPVSTAHQKLLDQGWSVSNDALNANPYNSVHHQLKAPLPSLITCSGTGEGLCAYGYNRKGKRLRLIAQPNGSLLRWLDVQ